MRIVFVLVGTTHSGNLGAVARAIKTMGFSELRLVDACSPRSEEAIARASGAQDVLAAAGRFDRLEEAITDCRAVYGASARARGLSVPMLDSREACERLMDDLHAGQVDTAAVVFGRERSGLTNEELDLCTRHLHIPSDPAFSSLNLGAAVQVVAYELAQARIRRAPRGDEIDASGELDRAEPSADHGAQPGKRHVPRPADPPANGAAMGHLFAHLERVMLQTGFLDPDNPRHLMRRVRGYFERNRPTDNELAILRGILSATEQPKRRDSGPAAGNRDGRPG